VEGITKARRISGKPGAVDLQCMNNQAAKLWESFRLRRTAKIKPEALAALKDEAQKAFGRQRE
jgi:hypothetical protein